jgi:hypothetical protein
VALDTKVTGLMAGSETKHCLSSEVLADTWACKGQSGVRGAGGGAKAPYGVLSTPDRAQRQAKRQARYLGVTSPPRGRNVLQRGQQ